jgi:hypothetical protein
MTLPCPYPAACTSRPAPRANVLLSGDRVILAASAPDTAALIRQRGYEVHTIDIGQVSHVPSRMRVRPRSSLASGPGGAVRAAVRDELSTAITARPSIHASKRLGSVSAST